MTQLLDEKNVQYDSGYYIRSMSFPRESFLVTLEKGEDNWIIAKCPELNVVTQGKTYDEAERNAIDAIELVLDDSEKTKQFSISVRRLS